MSSPSRGGGPRLSAADLPSGRASAPTSVLAVVLLLQALPFWPGHVPEEPSVSTEEDVLNSETRVGREVGLLLFSRMLNTTSVLRFIIKRPKEFCLVSAFLPFLSREVAEVAFSPGPCVYVVAGKVTPFMATLILGAP